MVSIREQFNNELAGMFDDITVELDEIRRMVLSGYDRERIADELSKLEEALSA